METLKKGKGVFKLNDSNLNVGSFFLEDDIKQIFNFKIDLPFINGMIDEKDLMSFIYDKKLIQKDQSFDEIVLECLIKKAYPNSEIIKQERIGRYKMDLKVTNNFITKYIEFDGPNHFCLTRYGYPKDPFLKKKIIEDKTGIEVINWGFWIQRCTNNVKAIFEPNIQGYGALWSSNYLFGDFVFDNSAEIIFKISKRFNAWDEKTGVCNFYIENSMNRIKPKHPILDKPDSIKIKKMLPKGFKNKNYWIPEE